MENEQKETEKTEATATAQNNDGGNIPKEKSFIERADALNKMLEEKEKRIDEKIKKFDLILANRILSGKGEIIPVISQEEKDREDAQKIVKSLFG